MKYSFFDVDPESAHPEIIKHVLEHNLDHFVDPKQDPYSSLGTERLKKAFGLPAADIYYMPNGTGSNITALATMLKPFEGVICPATGHINNYEAGALEATGHKILAVEAVDGKLTPAGIDAALKTYKGYYTVVPRAVYLTQVTEEGTVYAKDELTKVIDYAKSKGLYVYLDGARLAMALASQTAAMTLKEFGQLDLDMFYVGGTKNGGLYGEAIVIKNDALKQDFPNHRKRQGSEVSKERVISLQFARFFDDDGLWLKLGEHANHMAGLLRQGLAEAGTSLDPGGDANHAFITLNNQDVDQLEKDYKILRWQTGDDTARLRLVCSWATTAEDIDEFVRSVKALVNK